MLQLYRGRDGRIRVVTVIRREDMVPAGPIPPEAYGMPWSQVPHAQKVAMLDAEAAHRAARLAQGLPVPDTPLL